MDYRDLVWKLRYCICCEEDIARAATAIETLQAERDAAMEELRGICWCCANGKPSWSWRPDGKSCPTAD